VGPNYIPPVLDAPDRWRLELAEGLATGDADLQTWWQVFEDPLLESLVERAQDGNLDLAEAFFRIDESRARRGLARGEFFPDADATGDYARERISEDFGIPSTEQNRNFDFYSSGLDVSWEIDFFGRIRRSLESASARLEASVEDFRDILVSLLSEVARTYVDVRTLQTRLDLAEKNVVLQQGTLELTRDRNRAGLVGDLDVAQAELNLATTEAFVPFLRASLIQSINRLGVLIGEAPGALHDELREAAAIPEAPEQVTVGLPLNLLRQRPDLRRAERDLAAQTARIGVATADLYPRFTILGTFAFDATSTGDLFTRDAGGFSIGPAVRWNLFDGGRVRSQIEVEDARTEQELVDYERTLLVALQEAEDSMVAYAEERKRRTALARSVKAAIEATELVQSLYRAGLTDFQNVLDTQRSLFEQEDAFAESEGRVTGNLIRVYEAFGGGWAP
jgi:NodT family efflux transporter outer membrane factor (OMF) lipoprotein